MGEFLAALFEGIAALLELAFHALVMAARRAITLVAYVCSRTYRARKETEWQGRRPRKFLELGFSALCLAGLICLGVWLPFVFRNGKAKARAAHAGSTNGTGKVEFGVQVTGRDGTNRSFTLTVNEQGMDKIIAAEDLKDLAKRIKENVRVVGVRTNAATNHSIKLTFSNAESIERSP